MPEDNRKRARTGEQKLTRRDAILAEAEALVTESGFAAVTMADLAQRAGLAKGTLYLYFRTKEEVFLALFLRAFARFADRIVTAADADDLVRLLTDAALGTSLFLPLYARLTAVIEANVDDETLYQAKRAMTERLTLVAAAVGRALALPPGQAAEVTDALVLVLQGAAQFDLTARRDPAGLPDDLRPVFARHAFRLRFPAAARQVIAGAQTMRDSAQ